MAKEQEVKLEAELKKLMQQRLDLEKQVVEQKAKMDSAEKKSIENIKKLISLEAVLMDSVEKEEEVRKKIEKIEKESEDRTKKREKSEKESLDRNKKQEQSQQTINKFQEERASLVDKVRGFGDDELKNAIDLSSQFSLLTEKAKAKAGILSETANINTVIADKYNSIADNIEKGYDYSDRFKSSISDTKNITDDITKLYAESIVQTGEIEKGTAKIVETDKSRQALALKRSAIESGNLGLNDMEKAELLAMLALDEQRLNAIDEQNKVIEAQNAKVQAIQGIGSKLGDAMSSWVTKLPGGEQIYKLLGIDKTADKMNKSFTSAIQNGLKGNFKAAFAEGAKGLGTLISMGPKLVAGMGLGAITGGIGLMGAGIKKLGSFIMAADGEVAQMGKDFAMSYKEAGVLYKNTNKIAAEMNIVGINSKEVAAGIQVASEAFQGVDVASAINSGNKEMIGFVKQASILSTQFGLSGQEIANIKDIATIAGTSMDQMVKESVELGKGTMNAKETMKVLAGIPKEVAVGFKGSSKELVAAAQKAKLLGQDLKKIKDIGRGMLDLESSLTAEFEAQAITGKNMNLDTARRLAMNGDIFGLQEELLDKAGSLEEFQNMNVIQQEAMAKAMGMSVEEMTTMLTNAQKLKDADIDSDYANKLSQMKDANALEAEAGKARTKEQKDYIMQLAAEKRSASIKEKMADILEKIKAKFAPIVEAVTNVMHGMFDSTKGASKLDDMIKGINVEEIAAGLKEALPKLMEAVQMLIKRLPDIIKFVTKIVEGFSGAGGAVGGLLGFINPSIAGVGALALKVAGPGGIAAGFKIAGKGAMGLFDMVKGPLGDSIGKLAGGVTDKLGGAFGKVGEKAGGMFSKATGALGKIKMPGGAAGGDGGVGSMLDKQNENLSKSTKMADGAQSMGKKIADFGKGLGDALKSIGKGIGGAIQGVFEGLAKGLEALGKGLATMTPIGPVVAVVSLFFIALGAALYLAAPAIKAMAPILMKFADVLGGAFAKLIEGLAPIFEAIGSFIKGLIPVLMSIVQVLGKVFIEAIRQIPAIIKSIFEGISGIVTSIGGVIVEVINSIGDNIVKIVDKLMSLANLDPAKLAGIALGIGMIGGALAAFGAGAGGGALLEGLGSLVGGDSPIDQLLQIIEKVDPAAVAAVAGGIASIAAAMKSMADNMGNVDASKLGEFGDALSGLMTSIGGGALMEGVGKLLGGESPLVQIQNLISSLQPEKLSTIAKSLIEVSTSLKTLADTIAGMDVEKLGEVFSKINQGGGESKASKVMDSIVGGISSLFGGGEKEGEKKGGEQKAGASAAGGAISTPAATAVSPVGMQAAAFTPSGLAPAGAGAGGAGAPAAGGGGGMGGVESKLDQLISLFGSIANQPTVIKFGDKFVEEIRSTLNVKKTYNVEDSFGRR